MDKLLFFFITENGGSCPKTNGCFFGSNDAMEPSGTRVRKRRRIRKRRNKRILSKLQLAVLKVKALYIAVALVLAFIAGIMVLVLWSS